MSQNVFFKTFISWFQKYKCLDGDKTNLILNIRKLLGLISGFTKRVGKQTIIDMLSDVLDTEEREMLSPKYKVAIEKIAQVIKIPF